MVKKGLGKTIIGILHKKPKSVKHKSFPKAVRVQVRKIQRGRCVHCKK